MSAADSLRNVTPAQVAERLRGEKRVLAVSHEAPDGDALGCLSAFLLMCERLEIPCEGFIPGESGLPPEYLFLPRVKDVLRGDPPALLAGTTVYFLDCASLLRSNSHKFPEDAVRVNIDHHGDNPGYGEYNLVDPAAASTTVILYEIFKAGDFPIDGEVATGLYVGLVTDTGRFQYSNPLPKLLLLERALRHLEVRLGGALAVSWLGNDDFVQAGADEGHAEGLIDTLRRINGVRVAALARERATESGVQTKVSLRSTDGSLNVAELAHKRGGGGHIRAAGFTSDDDVESVLAWIESEVGAAL